MLPYAPMHTQILLYQKDSAELFDHFVHLPHAIFIDSCRDNQLQGRYDIITADPTDVLREASDGLHGSACGSKYEASRDKNTIFQKIKTALNKLKSKTATANPHSLPFTIGAIGYLSYDIGRSLETIPNIAIADIGLPQAFVGIYDWSIVVDHQEQKTYFSSINNSEKINLILSLLEIKLSTHQSFSITKSFQSNMTKNNYQQKFDQIKKHIYKGNCYQVNLAQRFTAQFEGDPWYAYRLLRKQHPAPYSAFIKLDNAAILSVSPERFIKVSPTSNCTEARSEDRALIAQTKPIKGTAKRSADPTKDAQAAQALLHSEKDHSENVMIVDLLRNDLSRSCVAGSVHVPTLCALESFSNVHHLVSTITGKLKPTHTPLDLLKNCFPGGSITGAPKIAAMKIIESLEPHRRSVYCGSIFYADINDHFDSNIAIRTVISDHDKMHVYAGGGIVYDSECESEYQECLAKVGNILKILEQGYGN